jgi:hypothetical protein
MVLLLWIVTPLTACRAESDARVERENSGNGMEQVRGEGSADPCSAHEIDEVLNHLQAVVQASATLDVMRIIDVWLNLEQTVSSDCWLAANRHVDPRVVNACTVAELDHTASFAGPMLRAARELFRAGDMMSLLDVSNRVFSGLSGSCVYAMQAVQAQAQHQMSQGSPAGTIPSVLDHGGGTFSVPNMGSCGPSGCIAF